LDEMFWQVKRYLINESLVEPGSRIVLTAGAPLNVPGTTNLIKVLEIE
jgi:pyruvate kinase